MEQYSVGANELLSSMELYEIKAGKADLLDSKGCTVCLVCISCTMCISKAIDIIIIPPL